MKTIRGRIVIISTSMLIITIMIITAISVAYLGGKVMDETKEELSSQATYFSREIYADIEEKEGLLEAFRDAVVAIGGEDSQQIKKTIDILFSQNPDYMNIYFGSITGEFIKAENGGTLPEDYDPRVRDWYISAKETGGLTLSNPYVAKSTGKMCTTIAMPVIVNGALKGVVGVDIPLEKTINTVDSIVTTESAYGFLVDADGAVICHREDKFMPTEESKTLVSDINPELDNLIDSGDTSVHKIKNYEGVDSFFAVSPVGDTGWKLITVVSVKNARIGLQWALINTSVVALIIVIISAIICLYKVRKEISPLDKLVPAAEAIGNGDFSVPIEHGDKKGEVGELQNSFYEMAENIKSVIEEQRVTLAKMAEGNLDIPDMTEHPGEFNRISEQINSIKATLNAIIVEIQFAAVTIQSTSVGCASEATPEEMANVFEELSDEANALMEKANMFITNL